MSFDSGRQVFKKKDTGSRLNYYLNSGVLFCVLTYTAVQMYCFGVSKILFLRFWLKYNKNSNTVKYYCNLK